jgi:branched-chain amino acid transport system ATP-binding protein
MEMLLELKNLQSGYAKIVVLHGVSMFIHAGEIVGLIGHNGAGKTTMLRSIYGLLRPCGGAVIYMNQDITYQLPAANIDRGLYLIPQDRFIFDDLTVKENLEMSSFTLKDRSNILSMTETVYELFPKLRERIDQFAGTLSGGERRILSLAMGFLKQPKLLMLDEPSGGLSPIAVQHVAGIIRDINRDLGTSVLLVAQNVKTASKLSKRMYVMKAGRIILEETGEKLLQRKEWWDLF